MAQILQCLSYNVCSTISPKFSAFDLFRSSFWDVHHYIPQLAAMPLGHLRFVCSSLPKTAKFFILSFERNSKNR